MALTQALTECSERVLAGSLFHMADVDMTDAATEEEALLPVVLNVLQYVKVAQSQHGLRHSDYVRYR